ncbi:hypothetical protein GCM10011575_48220 [Microlunatus endophyticus]|uniref:Nudix hydrolase domain-containing protein n=1 Tax=Microlunatus endophyticus TaxID=1716077 RepID=A0A917SL30_9ACTN|nr:NUDIX domain-containing protein [Microlunatus endophyticus]GGL84310.1 hypothetical protein GCM10011575_48220 [Microlunatus endophyticus]
MQDCTPISSAGADIVTAMPRLAVKLLLLDQTDRLLLIHARDPKAGTYCWYPVGGGVEEGESLQDAAAREAYEETGLRHLPQGQHVWRRDHVYRFNGRIIPVHEKWLLHRIEHFQPAPSELTDAESQTIVGFDWWNLADLATTTETVYPPQLGRLTSTLLGAELPKDPIDISEPPNAT